MVFIDLSKPDEALKPGIDLWSILGCEEAKSRGGDQMLKIKFSRDSDPSCHLYDIIMLEGAGWGIGKQKLAALLGKGFSGELDTIDLLQKRIWVNVVVDTYDSKDRLKVGIEELAFAGYQPESQVPPGKTAPEPVAAVDSVPF